jgi:ribosomal protein L37AE/L43A
MEKRDDSKIRCEKCGSSFGYLRMKDHQWVCRSCGTIKDLKEKREDKK